MARPDAIDGAAPPPHPATVVVVNDSEGALYMTALMLRRAGFTVLEAKDGASALALADTLPAVVVLDVRLPDIDGFEVCRRIRANPRTAAIKVLHTSATFVTTDKKVQGLEVGADGYLTQPYEEQELVAVVQSLVRLQTAEDELRDRADELTEAGRRKDEFLAMLAHELRNPLSAITASLPLLCQQPAINDQEVRAREIVRRQVRHLATLVDDLLDVARVTRGKIELHPTTIDLGALLLRITASARDTKAGPRKQLLSVRLPAGRLLVHGDATRLEQIFTNLLDNASKYTDAGGSIRVAVDKLTSGATARARITIRDTGIGIAASALPTIFELFTQADVAIDRSRGGLGIGLTLVKALVELHGGCIAVSSAGVGEGTEVEVELPLIASADVHEPTREQPAAEAGPRAEAGRRILLVEDNADARQMLADLWELRGHRVSTAGDGVEGVQVALAELPEIAFIDLGLPGLDGYEVARRIRAEPAGRDLFLVALTGYGSPEHKARSLEAGFDLHLVKPVDPRQVEALLADLGAARTSSRRRQAGA